MKNETQKRMQKTTFAPIKALNPRVHEKKKIIFITGTDTGVGKTVLTAFLIHHLRQMRVKVLGMKPFCSGDRGDVHILRKVQNNDLELNEINPFYYSEPVAPLASSAPAVPLKAVLNKIQQVAERCDVLIIEGSGGLMVPLGKDYMVIDLIAKLSCEVVLVSRNKLGTINHTLLSIWALQNAGIKNLKIVSMEQNEADISALSNEKMIKKNIKSDRIVFFSLPFFRKTPNKNGVFENSYKKIKKTLAGLGGDT